MGKSAIAKIGGGSPAREVKQKLKVDEYVLEINNEDIGKAEVTYSFDKIECTKYEAGQKSEVTYEDVIFIDVFGKNKEGLDAGFSFLVTMGLDSLNQYPKEPSNTHFLYYVRLVEPFKKPPKNFLK